MGRDLLIWMIAGATTAQTFAQGIQGILDRRLDHFLLYFLTAIILLLIAASIESVKGFLEAF